MKSLFYKRRRKSTLLLSILVITFLAVPKIVFAAAFDSIVAEFIVKAVYAGVIVPLKEVIQLELWLLPIIAQYNNFTREAGVIIGWTTVRNLCNMFFIVILLIIAFATVLKMQSYGYRQLLKRFIIMAILINFSRTIVGVLIDFSQIIMLTFVNVIKSLSAGNLTIALGLQKLLSVGTGAPDWNQVGMFVLAAIMLFIVVIVIMALIAILVMRIVTLWILIVLSPLAFVSFTFPKSEKYFSQWSEQLGSNLFAGPALAFFLWLAFAIVGNGTINESFGEGANDYNGAQVNSVSEAATPANMINFIVGIAILLAGIKMTQTSGVAGAALAGTAVAASKGMATRMGKRAAGGTARLAGKGVAGGAKLAWQGTSGEGMMKAGLSRVGRGVIGSQMAQHGPGVVKQWGARLEAAELGRRQRKSEHAEKGKEGVRDPLAYAQSKGGKIGDAMVAKEKLASGAAFTPDEARKGIEALKFQGNTEDAAKLQARVATANDAESVQANVDKNGVEDTFSKMSFAGAVDAATGLDKNAEAAVRVFLQQDPKAQQTTVDRMSSKDKDSFMEALAAYDPSADTSLTPEKRDVLDGAGNLQKGSVGTGRMMLLANNSAEHATSVMSAAPPAQREAVAKFRAETKFDIDALVKMKPTRTNAAGATVDNEAFLAIAKNLNSEQTTQFLSRSTDDSQKQAVVSAQMGAGKNLDVLTQKGSKYVNNAQIQQSFDVQVAAGATREDLAKDSLPYAEQAFTPTGAALDKVAFANFVVSKLTADQAASIGPEALDKIKTELLTVATSAGGRGAALLDALKEKHGIDLT